jgi:hypothetical protein
MPINFVLENKTILTQIIGDLDANWSTYMIII